MGDQDVRVSVVIPCFNVADYLPAALEQLRRQSMADFEIIVVDDGSTDGSVEIARDASRRDGRIRVLESDENRGVAAARGTAVQVAKAPWIWFVDADDRWPDDALDILCRETDDRNDVVVAGARYVYDDGRSREIAAPRQEELSGAQAFSYLMRGQIKGHLWNKLFRTSLLREIEIVPSRVHSDLSTVAQALSVARIVRTTQSRVYDYCVRPGSIITSKGRRAESLRIVDTVVTRAAAALGPSPARSRDLLYFRHRFILLSALKDAGNPTYTRQERQALIDDLRREVKWQSVPEFLRRFEPRRAAVVGAIKISPAMALTAAHRLGA